MARLAEVVRSGFVEGHHHGSVVGLDSAARVVVAVGDPDRPVFPRSVNKPFQVTALLRLGVAEAFGLHDRHIAVAASSHSGEAMHLALVTDLLARCGRAPADLGCPPEPPLSEAAARDLLADGRKPERLHHNCSGKHAAMLATAIACGWPTDGYLDPAHPVQRAVRAEVERLTGASVAAVGVDGCGAPLFALPLTALARGFHTLVTAPPGTPEARVAAAMRAHPDVVGGSDRDVTRLMRAVPGLLAKDGAEGVFAAALPDGPAVALKIDDGAGRARTPVLVAVLQATGVRGDAGVLAELAETPVFGGGVRVGGVRALSPLLR